MENTDKYETLKRLKGLLDAGVLSQIEFDEEKASILGNDYNDEQKAHLKRIKALRDAGILTEKEFEEQKQTIPSPEPPLTNTSSIKQATSVSDSNSATPKKKSSAALWIVLGVVASIVVIALVLGNSSSNYYYGGEGLYSNPYSEIDDYLVGYDDCYRDGNTVYCQPYQDYSSVEALLGDIINNPDALSPLGETITDVGRVLSGSAREAVLSSLIEEYYGLLQMVADNGLNLCYKYAGKNLFYYSPEEIMNRLSYY